MGGDGAGEGLFFRLRNTNTPAITTRRINAAHAPPNATNNASETKNRITKLFKGYNCKILSIYFSKGK